MVEKLTFGDTFLTTTVKGNLCCPRSPFLILPVLNRYGGGKLSKIEKNKYKVSFLNTIVMENFRRMELTGIPVVEFLTTMVEGKQGPPRHRPAPPGEFLNAMAMGNPPFINVLQSAIV